MAAGRGGFAMINRQRGVRFALPGLREFLERIRKELGLAGTQLVICFVTDAEMARMNEVYRQKRGPTDVLSFPAEQPRRNGVGVRARVGRIPRGTQPNHAGHARVPGREPGKNCRPARRTLAEYLGDIAISPATARQNAKKHGHGLAMELRILMLHGVLHLLGYDHETDHGEMDRLEMKLRRRFGLTWGI